MTETTATTITCPFCRESITAEAFRCKHCQSWLVPCATRHKNTIAWVHMLIAGWLLYQAYIGAGPVHEWLPQWGVLTLGLLWLGYGFGRWIVPLHRVYTSGRTLLLRRMTPRVKPEE